MKNEPKKCDGKSQCADFDCEVCGNREFTQKALGRKHRPQEGWEEDFDIKWFATETVSETPNQHRWLMKDFVRELIRQEKAASREEGYTAALDEAIGMIVGYFKGRCVVNKDGDCKYWIEQEKPDGHKEVYDKFFPQEILDDIISSLNALKGKGLNAKE